MKKEFTNGLGLFVPLSSFSARDSLMSDDIVILCINKEMKIFHTANLLKNKFGEIRR